MGSRFSKINKRLQSISRTSGAHYNAQTPSNPSPEHPGCATRTDENEETIIASIQASDVALGLRRVPAGFYAVVLHSGLEWKTENKPSSVNDDVIEWDGPIPIPSDLSVTVCIEVYASFEFQPVLGVGEQLRKLTITVEQLLDHSEKHLPFILSPKDGDVVSPCSRISITVKQHKCGNNDSSTPRVLDPHRSTTESPGELEDATNQGHSALSKYRKHGERQDLEHSIEDFKRALSVCPVDHPCRAAAQSNLAIAKFIRCQVEDTDATLEVPLGLYSNALVARVVGHFDRPSTLIQLAAVHLVRLEKQRDEVEGERAEALPNEAIELSSTESHEKQAVAFMLQLHAGCKMGPAQEDGRLLVDNPAAHFQYEELGDLEEAISRSRDVVDLTPHVDPDKLACLNNLGNAFLARFDCIGELSDLEDTIPTCLNSLGNAFLTCFDRIGELCDLEDAIMRYRDAVDLTPHGHPDKLACLNNLGDAFLTRFERIGELSDLEDAIARFRDAVDLTPHGHPDRPHCLDSLS